jgi:MFS family permease
MLVMRKLREPDAWIQARAARAAGNVQKLGSVGELFGDRRWRRSALVGMALGTAGIMGLWGVSFFLPDLLRAALKTSVNEKQLGLYVSYGMLLFNFAAAIGTYLFGLMMGWIGRKPTFALGFIAAIASIICVFGFMQTSAQVWWMAPLLGFCTLSLLGGYSVYFPELFPLRLRATGVGFCYNTARYVSALAPFATGMPGMLTGFLTAPAASERGKAGLSELTLLSSLGGMDRPISYAAIIVASAYLIGLLALPFAVETKGRPLPE